MLSEDQLAGLPRKEIQALAKEHGIKANLKTSLIIGQLMQVQGEPSPASASPAAASVADVSTVDDTDLPSASNEDLSGDTKSNENTNETLDMINLASPVAGSPDAYAEEGITTEAPAQSVSPAAAASKELDDDVDLTSPQPSTSRQSITASTYKAASRIFRDAESELRSTRRSSMAPRVATAAASAPRRGHSQVVQARSARARLSTPRLPGATPSSTRPAPSQRPTPVAAAKTTGASKAAVFDLAASLRRKPTWQMKLTKPASRPVLGLKQASRENTYADAKARRRREAMHTYSNRGGVQRAPLAARQSNQ